jgi:hypothetical protein
MSDETKAVLNDVLIDGKIPKKSSSMVNKLYDSLGVITGDVPITTVNVVDFVTCLMKIVETYPELSGKQKKSLVIHVIKKFVTDHLSGEEETRLLMFCDVFLPSYIDTIVAVDKKEIVLKIQKKFKSCFSCF